MKIEEAIVYCLATSNRGMRTEQIAEMINRQRLHLAQGRSAGDFQTGVCSHLPTPLSLLLRRRPYNADDIIYGYYPVISP